MSAFDNKMIIDGHLDISMNALEWNRDMRWEIDDLRKSEQGMTDKPDRGNSTVSLPELRKGNIGIVFATLIARYVKRSNKLPGWNSPHQAWAQTQGQLAWYKAMEEESEMMMINNQERLNDCIDLWKEGGKPNTPIGYLLTLEGADSLVNMDYLYKMYEKGLRAIGPAHYGPGTYAQGTDATGGIGVKGRELLKEMENLGMVLDATHLCDESFWEAMDNFKGMVWASHNNCRALVNHNRQFSDDQLSVLIERDAVIGIPLDAWMMIPGWVRGRSTPENTGLTLDVMVDHMDHICQLAGNAKHIAIGTDLDGAFGTEQCPKDLNTIADLRKLPDLLKNRGYSDEDINDIFSKNWLRKLNQLFN